MYHNLLLSLLAVDIPSPRTARTASIHHTVAHSLATFLLIVILVLLVVFCYVSSSSVVVISFFIPHFIFFSLHLYIVPVSISLLFVLVQYRLYPFETP
ncbi:hypothetical protein DFH29DRAFT_967437 [Suillus ampliporus]|nr:hypothetical protein DFH29DRAFT_967437 [Suillus ampliporus]